MVMHVPTSSEVFFGNDSKFKQDFTHFLKGFAIILICDSIKKPYSNAPLDHIHQVIYNMIFTKDLYIKVYGYIYPWGVTPVSV